MTTFHSLVLCAFTATLLLPLFGCGGEPATDPHDDHAPPASNRIAVPEAVRKNLGITFAKVERRRTAASLRLPGAFELLPQGRAEARPPFAGRVDVLVQPLQPVTPGQVLFTIDAPAWRQLQRELGELEAETAMTAANAAAMEPLLAACELHEQSLRSALQTTQQYVQRLEATQQEVGGQAQNLAEARVQAAQTQAQVAEAAEKHTQTQTRLAELQAMQTSQRQRRALWLAGAAASVGRSVDELLTETEGGPRWRTLGQVEVRAHRAGIVERIAVASGGWVDAGSLVLTTVDPSQVRLRAQALQSDLARLRDGLPTRIEPIGAVDPAQHLDAQLQLAAAGDPLQRTIELFAVPSGAAPFVRPGVAATMVVETLSGGDRELAIPRACVLPDGLQRVFFRRDPNDPDQVIRIEADLGVDDGRWVEVKSGLTDGDEVVLHGAYELVLASSGQAQKGGHFHADGTFHADDHK